MAPQSYSNGKQFRKRLIVDHVCPVDHGTQEKCTEQVAHKYEKPKASASPAPDTDSAMQKGKSWSPQLIQGTLDELELLIHQIVICHGCCIVDFVKQPSGQVVTWR